MAAGMVLTQVVVEKAVPREAAGLSLTEEQTPDGGLEGEVLETLRGVPSFSVGHVGPCLEGV